MAGAKRSQQLFESLKRVQIAKMKQDDPRPHRVARGLFLGSVAAAYNLSLLKQLGITHILTVCDCLPPKFPGEFQYKLVNVLDAPTANIRQHFKETHEFIATALQRGGTVLVHCFAGVSRSATVVLAYLMKQASLSLQEAIYRVRSKRPFINPNAGFMNQLRKYEAFLKLAKQSNL